MCVFLFSVSLLLLLEADAGPSRPPPPGPPTVKLWTFRVGNQRRLPARWGLAAFLLSSSRRAVARLAPGPCHVRRLAWALARVAVTDVSVGPAWLEQAKAKDSGLRILVWPPCSCAERMLCWGVSSPSDLLSRSACSPQMPRSGDAHGCHRVSPLSRPGLAPPVLGALGCHHPSRPRAAGLPPRPGAA